MDSPFCTKEPGPDTGTVREPAVQFSILEQPAKGGEMISRNTIIMIVRILLILATCIGGIFLIGMGERSVIQDQYDTCIDYEYQICQLHTNQTDEMCFEDAVQVCDFRKYLDWGVRP